MRLPQWFLNECAAGAAGDIRPWANVGVSKGSDEAVAELSASVADEAVAELVDDKSLLEGRVPHVGDGQCVAELRSECAADAAGGIRPWANVGVSKGSDEAVAELAASVVDEASRWRPCGRSSSEQ